MLKQFITIVSISLLISANLNAQLKLNIITDKQNYVSGEPIIIKCIVKNLSDTTIKVISGTSNSMQAEYYFNDFYSLKYTIGSPLVQVLIFPAKSYRTYKWTLNPLQYGFPSTTGKQRLIGTYFTGLRDTTYINSEKVYGGWMSVGYLPKSDSSLNKLKDSLKIQVLERYAYSWSISERWQLRNVNYDSLFAAFAKDKRFSYVEHCYWPSYDSITFTGIEEWSDLPNSFSLSQNYPNPFNPSTTIKYTVPVETRHASSLQHVTLKVFDLLGRQVASLVDEFKQAGNYQVQFSVETGYIPSLPSGIYFYRLQAGNYSETKKMMLMK